MTFEPPAVAPGTHERSSLSMRTGHGCRDRLPPGGRVRWKRRARDGVIRPPRAIAVVTGHAARSPIARISDRHDLARVAPRSNGSPPYLPQRSPGRRRLMSPMDFNGETDGWPRARTQAPLNESQRAGADRSLASVVRRITTHLPAAYASWSRSSNVVERLVRRSARDWLPLVAST
jgi:hypothetical protein